MKQRVLCFFMTIVAILFYSEMNISVYAESADEDLSEKSITVVYNKSVQKINILEDKDHNYYMDTNYISTFSHFKYSSEKSTFYYDSQNPDSYCPKEVLVNKNANGIWVKTHWLYCDTIQTQHPFTRIIDRNGITYLPISTIFPCLDTSVDVIDGKLIITPAESTVAESLCNIDVNDLDHYLCSLCDFSENKKIVFISTLYEDLANHRISRLPFIRKMFPDVSIKHFENAFTDYLLDDSAYLKAVKESESAVKQISRNTINAYESLKDDVDGVKTFQLFPKEIAKKMAEANRIDEDWLGDTTLYDGFEKIGDGLDIASFGIDAASASIATYNAHEYAVADNIAMLNTVYDLDQRSFKYEIFMEEDDIQALAAQNIYKRSSEELITAISDTIKNEIVKFGADKLTEMALDNIISTSWIDGERWIISKLFPSYTTTTDIMEKLPYHYTISTTALLDYKHRRYNAFQERNVAIHYGHESRTEEHITKARQSLILFLMASKHCYSSIRDAYEAYHQKFKLCDERIAEIDELLAKLYLAGFSVKYDSLESLEKDIKESSKKLSNLATNEPVNDLNISATVFAKDYQIPDTGPYLALYEAASGESKQITSIPKGSKVNIISIPDNYQDGVWNHKMALVNYNGQEGYVHTNYLLCDPEIDMSSYTNEQLLDVGKILFEEYDNLSYVFALGCGFTDTEFGNDYYENYEKILPKGLTIQGLKNDFYNYFSKDVTQFFRCCTFEDLYIEKDGYLWRATGWGDEVYLDHYEVKAANNVSDAEIVFEVDELLIPDFYDIYHTEKFTYDFKIVKENGKWMLTIPEEKSVDTSSQSNLTYEDIYGSLVFDGVNNTKGLYGHEDYIHQPTGYQIQQYFLDDINNDGVKELILEITVSGTDETFRECYTYKDGSVKWCGTYTDIYMLKDCYLAADGNGLVVISWGGWSEDNHVYAFHYWRLWDITEKDHLIPYIGDFPEIGDFHTDSVEMHTPYNSIPEHIRSKLGKQLTAYMPSDRSPLQEHLITATKQPVSNRETSDRYTAIQGVVNTEKSDLMLRRLPDANDKTNVIAKIPKGTKIALLLPFKAYFADDDGGRTYWYYAEYNGKTGFVSAKYIKETNNRIIMTDDQITSVAKLLYITAMNAESWLYSNCFDYSTENQTECPDSYPHSNEFWYYPISDIRTTEDWYAQIHKQFSAKYDSDRNYGEGLEGLIISHDSYPPYYWNNNGQWYLLDAIFRKGDIPLDIAYSEPFKVVHLTKQSETENEIFFNGYLDFTNVQTEWLYDGGIEEITNFSICFEDGEWKVGKFIPIQY